MLTLIIILPNDFSREKLIENLGKQPAGIFPVYEFGEFMSKFNRDYMLGVKEFLADLWDSPSQYKRSLKGCDVTINNPAISLLGATTIEWLEDKLTQSDLRGGFFPEYFSYPPEKRRLERHDP